MAGNTSISSLLSAAKSAQARQQSYDDQVQSMQWQYGPQDQAAFDQYTKFLQGRVTKLKDSIDINDQSKLLTYQKELQFNVPRTFRSNQRQMATINIQEGHYTDAQKADLLRHQAEQAYADGDVQNGQAIEQMYNTQIMKIQNQQVAAYNAAVAGHARAQAGVAKSYNSDANTLNNALNKIENDFQHGKMSQKDYVSQGSKLYQALNNLYSSARQDPGLTADSQLAFDTHLQDLQKRPAFNLLTNPDTTAPGALKTTIDPGTGLRSIKQTDVVGETVDKDGNIVPIRNLNPDAKSIQSSLKSGKATLNVQKGDGIESVTVFAERDAKGKTNGQFYFIDPDTKQKMAYDATTGQSAPYVKGKNPLTPIHFDNIGKAKDELGKIGGIAGSVVGKGINDITSLFNGAATAQHQRDIKAAFQAAVAKANAERLTFSQQTAALPHAPGQTPTISLSGVPQNVKGAPPTPASYNTARNTIGTPQNLQSFGINPWIGVTDPKQQAFLNSIGKGQYNWGQAYGAYEAQFHTPVSTGSPIDQAFHSLNSQGYFK